MTPGSALSPSLQVSRAPGSAAYELKFTLTLAQAAAATDWARRNLTADPHGDPALDGAYRIVSLYLDTVNLDVYHRADSFRRRKYRLRRYGDEQAVYLERKTKRGDRVRKRRSFVSDSALSLLEGDALDDCWDGSWFHRQTHFRQLRPALLVGYQRLAFLGTDDQGPLRLTMDRSLCCSPSVQWAVGEPVEGIPLLNQAVILELKYHNALPPLFRRLLEEMGLAQGAMSKYRQGVEAWRLGMR